MQVYPGPSGAGESEPGRCQCAHGTGNASLSRAEGEGSLSSVLDLLSVWSLCKEVGSRGVEETPSDATVESG